MAAHSFRFLHARYNIRSTLLLMAARDRVAVTHTGKRGWMDKRAVDQAAALLVGARRTGKLLAGLPADCRPATVADAHAIQDATLAMLGESAGALKVSGPIDGRVVRGAIIGSRIFDSPARVRAADMPMLGVEAEIAFRFDRAVPPGDRDYTYAEVAAAVTALVAIEIVDTRFQDYATAPLMDRIADCVSNGGFVRGAPRADWRAIDLPALVASLSIDGKTVVRQAGGHVAGDPLLPAVALVNDLRTADGVGAGLIVTTGTYTGLKFAKPGQTVVASFEGLGSAEVTFDA